LCTLLCESSFKKLGVFFLSGFSSVFIKLGMLFVSLKAWVEKNVGFGSLAQLILVLYATK